MKSKIKGVFFAFFVVAPCVLHLLLLRIMVWIILCCILLHALLYMHVFAMFFLCSISDLIIHLWYESQKEFNE